MTTKLDSSPWLDPAALGPATDLYQLTMMAGYASAGIDSDPSTFELFVRRLPPSRSYLVFAGLEPALADLERLAFSAEQVETIRGLPAFRAVDPAWFDSLAELRFAGDVWSVPEGTVVFAGEPIVRVHATLAEAQWVETLLLASLGYPTSVASKAARIVGVAEDRPLYDFGARRGHGIGAGMIAARSAYLAGFAGTSLVEAALRMGIPAVGTMAHSWVQAFASEQAAFAAFAAAFPDRPTLLVDTYDVEAGVRAAATLLPRPGAIRIDSGDLGELAHRSRTILDAAGRSEVQIIASGDLDEHRIAALIGSGAPIDAFGVGTELVTCRDAPALSMVYKLVEIGGEGRVKLSPGKRTYPLAKQIFRESDADGRFAIDRIGAAAETLAGEPLLSCVMVGGCRVPGRPALVEIREHAHQQLSKLPNALRALDARAGYLIAYSEVLEVEAVRLGIGSGPLLDLELDSPGGER